MFADEGEIATKPAWRRYGVPAAVTIFVLGGVWLIMSLLHQGRAPARPHVQPPHITQITLPPPPPPPPPPPTKQPPKPVEQAKAVAAAPKKMMAPPKLISPPAQVTTSITGTGPGSLANGNGGGGDCAGTDCGSGGDGAGDVTYYEVLVKNLVTQTLHDDGDLRGVKYSATVAFVFDRDGHVEGVTFQNFEGDGAARQALSRALRNVEINGEFPSGLRNGKPWVVRVRAS